MRPRSLDDVVGQEQLLGPGTALRAAIEKGTVGSMIFWGPPGSGKTTLALLLARYTDRAFVPFSAVTEGVPRVREIVADAEDRLATMGRGTILFVDEIHRLNTAQQDAFLPHVERGTITLVGATTENPSFEINGALLSRSRVFVLKPLDAAAIETLVRRAVSDREHGLGAQELVLDDDAAHLLAVEADGDARRALTVLEAAAAHVGANGRITAAVAREAMQLRFARHDKAGEEHFNLLSAYHKSLRGSDPQGALYWMARMLEGGEDPMTIFRRAIAMAAEDVGLADPNALQLAVAARDAYHMLGAPEGDLAVSRDDHLPGDGAQVEQRQSCVGRGAGCGARVAGRAGPDAHSECAHVAHEGTRVRQRVPVRARRARGIPSAGVSSGQAARHGVVRAGQVRLRKRDRQTTGVVGRAQAQRAEGRVTQHTQRRRYLERAHLHLLRRSSARSWSARPPNDPGPSTSSPSISAELAELTDTAGAVVVGEVTQLLERPNPGTYLGKGKMEELTAAIAS